MIAPIIVLVCVACAGVEIVGQWLDWCAMRRHQERDLSWPTKK
jgi:hypothetical protein